MKIKPSVDSRKLKTRKKAEQKYLVLLSNQVCVISYWPAIGRAIKMKKPILEILKVRKRVKAQVGLLEKIINLENETETSPRN